MSARYERHPLNFFPPLPQDRIEALAADIQVNGQRDPIWLFEGKILDGCALHEACVLAGMEPRVDEYKGEAPLDLVLSRNATRRSLTDIEKAFVAARLVIAVFEGRARSRMLAGTPSAPGREGGKAADEAARLIGIGARSVERVLKVLRVSPALAQAVQDGKVNGGLKAAEQACGLPAEELTRFLAADKPEQKWILDARRSSATRTTPPTFHFVAPEVSEAQAAGLRAYLNDNGIAFKEDPVRREPELPQPEPEPGTCAAQDLAWARAQQAAGNDPNGYARRLEEAILRSCRKYDEYMATVGPYGCVGWRGERPPPVDREWFYANTIWGALEMRTWRKSIAVSPSGVAHGMLSRPVLKLADEIRRVFRTRASTPLLPPPRRDRSLNRGEGTSEVARLGPSGPSAAPELVDERDAA